MTPFTCGIVQINMRRKNPVKWAIWRADSAWEWIKTGLASCIEEAEQTAARECAEMNRKDGAS